MLRFCFSYESGGWCFGERFGDPQGCPFGSMLDNNTNTDKLNNTLKNTEKYLKIQKSTDLQGCPFGSMLNNNTNAD